MEDSAGGVVGEIYAKHRNSTQPESQQVCAVLGAVLEVVQAEGLQPTPTALFAALMSSLEKPETQASSQVCLWSMLYRQLYIQIASDQAVRSQQVVGAMCSLLASVLGRVPSQILRSKFHASVQVMQQIVEQSDQQVYFVILVAAKQLLQCSKMPCCQPALQVHCFRIQ